MTTDRQQDDGEYEELSADAGDERRIRRQADALASVQQPESAGAPENVGDASPDEVEVPKPHGESVEYMVRPFDEQQLREEDAQDAATTDVEGQPLRVRDRLDDIEREVDAELENDESGIE